MNLEEILTPRELKILRMRYQQNKTLKEVGEQFDVTRERIRQIEAKARRKVKSILDDGMIDKIDELLFNLANKIIKEYFK